MFRSSANSLFEPIFSGLESVGCGVAVSSNLIANVNANGIEPRV
ncbi:hypothetical protein OS176_03365 [Xanthomonadaceae bacterium XH05]|nr:hypothetical protein [Xanthomonadaceae bacterium XH05]